MDAASQIALPAPLGAARVVRPIFALGAPLVGFYLIQNVVSIATVAMLGRLGNAAIAGAGVSGALYTATCALLWGIDTGVQAAVARTTGAGRKDRVADILAAAHAGAIPLAAILGAALWAIGPRLVAIMLPDRLAAAAGGAWIVLAAPSIVLLAATLPINAVWIGSGRPALAMAVTAFSAPLQIALTLLFVLGAGPVRGSGIAGAAVAMDVTMLAGVFVQFVLAFRFVPGFLRVRPRPPRIAEIAAIGWPISTQQSLLQVALMGVFAIVGQLGAAAAAIVNVLLTLTAVAVVTETALGVAAATLVGQALGRGEVAEARAWGWRTTAVAVALTAPMGLVLVLAPHALLAPFLRDPATLSAAILPGRIAGLATVVGGASVVLGFAFRGAGATKIAAAVPFVSLWLIQLPLMAWIGLTLGQGLTGIIAVQAGVSALDAVALGFIWAGPWWTRVRIDTGAAVAALPSRLRRIAVLGGGGAGKSTLARRLGEALGLPVVHLDRLVYGPGWVRRDAEALRAGLLPAFERDAWIVEGTYAEASALTLPAADLVLWLDQPVWLRLFRSWRKTVIHRRRPRPDRPDGCEERFGWAYVRLVLEFGAWSPALAARLEALAGDRLRRLRGDAEARAFLLEIAARP
ncbi:MAG TPA: MATE family efflux transporter [Caulobacteraceae bacterium]|nr:MATE family efflux transporter [Caulobacteraceae bacterium]